MWLLLPSFALALGLTATASAIPQTTEQVICSANSREITSNGTSIWPWQTYKSSDVAPPNLAVNRTSSKPLFDGLLFLDPVPISNVSGASVYAPLIMDDAGELVWQGPNDRTAANLRVQTLDSASVLTYWSGSGTAGAENVVGHGFGEVRIYDTKYNLINTVCPKISIHTPPGLNAKCVADVHESNITPRNTILVTVYNYSTADLSSIGGPKNGWVLDSMAAEVNISSGEVLFSWSPLAHLNLSDSHYPLAGSGRNDSNPYDFFHINAIQLVGDNYLINSRHFWSTFLVDPKGNIIWEINGKDGGDFGPIPEGGHFVSLN